MANVIPKGAREFLGDDRYLNLINDENQRNDGYTSYKLIRDRAMSISNSDQKTIVPANTVFYARLDLSKSNTVRLFLRNNNSFTCGWIPEIGQTEESCYDLYFQRQQPIFDTIEWGNMPQPGDIEVTDINKQGAPTFTGPGGLSKTLIGVGLLGFFGLMYLSNQNSKPKNKR